MMIILLREKLGQNPSRSIVFFVGGIGLFVIGLFFITIGYFYHYWWQIVGLILLFCACMSFAWGYLGMFANR